MVNRTSTAFRATCKRKKNIVSSFSLHNHLLQHILTRYGRNEGSSVVTADQELLVQFSKGKKPRQGSSDSAERMGN